MHHGFLAPQAYLCSTSLIHVTIFGSNTHNFYKKKHTHTHKTSNSVVMIDFKLLPACGIFLVFLTVYKPTHSMIRVSDDF